MIRICLLVMFILTLFVLKAKGKDIEELLNDAYQYYSDGEFEKCSLVLNKLDTLKINETFATSINDLKIKTNNKLKLISNDSLIKEYKDILNHNLTNSYINKCFNDVYKDSSDYHDVAFEIVKLYLENNDLDSALKYLNLTNSKYLAQSFCGNYHWHLRITKANIYYDIYNKMNRKDLARNALFDIIQYDQVYDEIYRNLLPSRSNLAEEFKKASFNVFYKSRNVGEYIFDYPYISFMGCEIEVKHFERISTKNEYKESYLIAKLLDSKFYKLLLKLDSGN